MIEVTFSPKCTQVMRDFGIQHDLVRITVNNRDSGLITDGLDRVVAAHWFGTDELVIIETIVTKKEMALDKETFRVVQVAANLALALCSELPSGCITKDMRMEEILSVVAKSFGQPVTCHPDQPASHLYTGRWNGEMVSFQTGGAKGLYHVVGSFDPEKHQCELVWAFNAKKYRAWLAENTISILVSPKKTPHAVQLSELEKLARELVENFPSLYPGRSTNARIYAIRPRLKYLAPIPWQRMVPKEFI